MIKVFTHNKNGNIELTVQELQKLLDEAYWEGYRNANAYSFYNYPNPQFYKRDNIMTSPFTCNLSNGVVSFFCKGGDANDGE
jgi:hypothetical protein